MHVHYIIINLCTKWCLYYNLTLFPFNLEVTGLLFSLEIQKMCNFTQCLNMADIPLATPPEDKNVCEDCERTD